MCNIRMKGLGRKTVVLQRGASSLAHLHATPCSWLRPIDLGFFCRSLQGSTIGNKTSLNVDFKKASFFLAI